MSESLTLLGIGTAVALVTMAVVWFISERIGNAGIVDVAWSGIFALLATVYGLMGSGSGLLRAVAAGMMIIWSLRLTAHLWKRNVGHLDVEDPRYAKLREKWGSSAPMKMLLFFQFQGVTNVLLSIVILVSCMNPSSSFAPVQWAGVILWIIALAGESVSDAQLKRFKDVPSNSGRVMDKGLWRLSRHPNYFFEWLVWVAWFLFALDLHWGWLTIYAPLMMLWFLYKVTGIPATEKHSLESRGEAYRRYQETTSPFIPWFPRRVTAK